MISAHCRGDEDAKDCVEVKHKDSFLSVTVATATTDKGGFSVSNATNTRDHHCLAVRFNCTYLIDHAILERETCHVISEYHCRLRRRISLLKRKGIHSNGI